MEVGAPQVNEEASVSDKQQYGQTTREIPCGRGTVYLEASDSG